MIIESIYIENFRCIKKELLNFNDLTVIIGRNGSGKSSFLKAIDIFYDTNALVTIEDFYNHNNSNEILIRVTYANLRPDEINEFKTYIRDNKLIVTKKINGQNSQYNAKYFAATMQIPQFADIRMLSKSDKRKQFKELIDLNTFSGLTGSIKSADDVDRLMLEYEQEHSDQTQPIEKEEQFFGAKTVGGGKLDNYTKFVLVPAVRELADETSDRKDSSLYQLLDLIVYRQINTRRDIKEFKERIDLEIKKIYATENLKELPLLGESISETLSKLFPGAKLNLNWEEVTPPDFPLPKAIATLIEDDFEGDITKKGHGLQRALIISLLQYLALSSPQLEENEAKESEIKQNKKVFGPDLILAIEEPELYLHPLKCRYLSKLLFDLAIEKDSATNQIIYTTHSPFFIDLNRFNHMRLVKKQMSADCECPVSEITQYSLNQAAEYMKKIIDSKNKEITDDTFRIHSSSVIDTIVNEGFFADAVVVVEGISDIGILWAMQEILKKNWISSGIAVIPAKGKNNIDRPVIVFKGFLIPTYFIFDADNRKKSTDDEKATIEKNNRYLKLAGEPSEKDFPKTTVKETWACFEDEIESYLKLELTESEFNRLRDETAKEIGHNRPSVLLKNIIGAEKFIKKAYSQGKTFPVLEDIVDKITNLIGGISK